MTAQQKLQETKFLAFAHGYKELLAYLNNIKIVETNYGYDLKSPWYRRKCNEEAKASYENWVQPGDYTFEQYKKNIKKVKEIETSFKTVVKQGRKCGMVFQHSDIFLARFK